MITETISGFRLSPHQKRLWLLQKESGAAYVAQSVICIEGNLKPEVLKAALQNIVNRHQILRTTFHCLPGMKIPVMVVKDSSVLSWREIYLSKDSSQKFTIASICQEEKSYPFDFEKGPLLRCSLLELSANKHILVVTLPALCADARTLKNLFAEISDSYSACLQGEDFSKEVVQYVQFSEWQNDLLEDSEAEAGKNYWSQQDFSALDTLTLPFADNFYQKTEFQPQVYTFTLSAHLTQEIKTNHRGAETRGGEGLNSNLVSLFLLSCWQILLWRFTGQTEMIVGKVCHGREYEELNDVLGLFAKSLPIRSRLNTDLHFSEVLQQVTQAVEEANEWQEDFIFEKNVESFPFLFDFEQLPEKCLASDALFSFDTQYICLEPFQIKLFCIDKEEFLELGFYYNANLFSADAIHRLAEQFQTLLASAIENPDVAISQLQILPPNQLEQLLIDFNQTQVDSPQNKCIHQLFEEQATLTPDKIAVVFEDKQLTYSELNQSANQLAHYLQKLGVQPDAVVGICLERSYLMIVAMLGVLKAGGAYLPLDPGLPKEAIAFRLQDAQVPILLTQQGIDSIQNSRVVCLDTDWKDIARESTENPTSKATPENLVYVIYTSGSTGKPKGVAIEHQQLCNYLYGILEKLELPKDASFATVSTFAADLGNTVIFPCLCTGGCLHVVSWERASDAAALAAYFRRHPIDCLKIVPSHISALLTSSDIESILPRQLLILGGEATDWHLVETIQQYAPHCRIINHYGPTETTVGVLTYTVSPQPPLISGELKAATVPIGRPIANTQVYVLDKQLQPVPIGVPGELYIGGKSLARSYLNRPELTADRFIANPFVDFKLDRLYKTGDLVRYLPDGNLEFLHRLDDQVKIRGFRIELGEISAVLSQHPAVQEVVVVAREDGLGDKRLVAYIVPSVPNTQHLTLTGDLRSLLKEKLPEYMIPSAFVVLKALPLTSNGKVDRHALPAPDEAALIEKTFVAPRTPVEEVIAAMWAQLLGVQRLSIDDNFFDLGGHSLLATQVISRLRTAFGVEIPLRQLFASPTVAGLAAHIETAMRAGQELETTAIPRAAKDKDLPLSFAQWRLWFLNQLEPESPSYNLPRVIRLTGSLNIAALEQSFNEVIKRHEVLRTTFTRVNGQPMQVIHPMMDLRLSILDCTTIPQSQIQNFIVEEVQQGFDLAKGPLLRAKLLQVGEQEHLLLLTMHHIVSDGWSTGVLIEQMAALYAAYCEGKPSPLPELPIQYADFAVWQREWLQGEQLQALLDYWKQQLQGDLPVLELPADRPRPAVQTFAGKEHSFVLSKELTQALKTLSQQQGVTLFMTLLAAFKTLLYRYTGQEDILIGSPIANRNRGEIETLIGFFVNTLVLRTDLFGNPSFQELLGRVREVTLGAYAHQDLPFEKLVEELQPERNLSHAPLFQAMFVFQNAPMKTLELPGLSIQPLKVNSGTAKFDLTLSMQDTEQGLIATFEYNTDLFDEATISRSLGHFQTLLAGIVANPQQRLSELPLLTATEQQQLVEWNNTKTEYGNELCLHQLFEAQVERTPDAVAVVYENEQLTYQELNHRANQLAHYLQKLGVGPEVLVGICLERSLEMVIALLGIFKAGGAYVPLDPSYPQQRLAFMLENSQPSVLLTQQRLLESLPTHTDRLVCLDTNWKLIARESSENPVCNTTVDNLAYVIYTSGSTGKPKGAMNTHRSICNRLLWMQDAYQLTAADKVLQKTPLSFDVSVWEFFLPLLTGARLVVARPEGHRDTNYLVNLIAQQQITTVHFVPSMLQVFLEAEGLESCKCITRVICSGEALPVELQKRFFNRLDAELHNLYGPTEAAVDVTFWKCVPQSNTHRQTVPIGRPIANIQIYLLDWHLNSVPVGVTGELYIGGVGVARGYLNTFELTAEKFIPNPFSNESGARLYKTGDLARYLPDGNLEFLGRIDYQVKIRGFRIELGEIEAVLNQHPAVRETVVVAREEQPGNKRLIAYIVTNISTNLNESTVFAISDQHSALINELRSFVKEKLPEYMVPSAFMLLEAMPLTPNGKVDRRALPALDRQSPEREADFIAPQTTAEKQLAAIWVQVLGLKQVGVNDNFFELGGDSILSLQVISRANQAGLHLTPKQLFQHQTIAQLAAVAGTSNQIQAEQGLVTGSVALTPIQYWFFAQDLPDAHHWNQSLLLEVQQPLNPVLLEQVVQSLLLHHDALRLRFTKQDIGWTSAIAPPDELIPLTQLHLSALPQEEQEAAIVAAANEFQASLNLSKGPLLRVAYFDLGGDRHSRLLLAIHHLVIDGVSWRILVEDMQTAYQQLSQGKAVQLPAKTTSFKQWSERLQEYAQSRALHSELDYWLRTHQPAKCIPVDYPGGENTEATAHTVSVALCVEETQALLQDVPAAYRTQINDVLLTALVQAFAQWTGQSSLLINLEGHGREELFEDIDLSRTVGWFTSMFPVLLTLGEAANPREALLAVKEQLRGIPNRGLGYGVLNYISGVKEISELPKPEVMFNYLGQFDQVIPQPSLFGLAQSSKGAERSWRASRTHLLAVNGVISQGRLQMNWTYSEKLHKRTTIEALAEGFIEALRSLIHHCQSPEVGGFTPSDFPLAQLDQTQLDTLFGQVSF